LRKQLRKSAKTKAIDDGHIKSFIAKPWNSEELLAMIEEEVQAFAL
jgi:response regulator RpfG family c-di-GMP phosphodiesterase